MLNIRIKTKNKVPRNDVADWYTKNGVDEIRIIPLQREEYEILILIHEIFEQFLCKKMGITDNEVNEWDGKNKLKGDDPSAPYNKEHKTAEKLEKYAAKLLGIDWKKYEESL